MSAKTVVGIDVGTTRLKAVEATITGGQPTIIAIASVSLPQGAVVAGEVKDVNEFANAVKNLWKQGKFTAQDVRVVINSEANIAKLTTMDDELDFNLTLPFRLKQLESFPSEEYYLSYHTLRKYEVQEKDSSRLEGLKTVPKRDILLAGAKRDSIDSMIAGFKEADLRPISVDIAPLSLIRAEVDLEDRREVDDIDIHVNVGGDITTIVVSHHAQPVYVRVIDIGGNMITESVADALDIDLEYAEQLKIEAVDMKPSISQRPVAAGGFFSDEEEETSSDTSRYTEDQLDAYSVVTDELGAIISNIHKTLIYFIEHNSYGLGDSIGTIHVSGGTAIFPQICQRLKHELGAENTLLSAPITRMQENGRISDTVAKTFISKQHELSLAIGAVLGSGGNKND